jgi:predicted amidohydrolase YtcJ
MTTPGWLLLRAQVLAVIVGLVSSLWLDNVRAAETGKADVVLWHGKIYTAEPAQSFQQAIAFTGNSIIAVGGDAKVAPLIGPKTEVIDLGGKLILPGLIDTHVHPVEGAVDGAKCSLADVAVKPPTIEALKPEIQKCLAKEHGGPDDWLEAVQLFNYGFKATARDLDGIEKPRPMVLEGNDGHTAWVNRRGLALLCKTVKTLNLPGGKIPCAASTVKTLNLKEGKIACAASTGFLVESDVDLVEKKIPPAPIEKRVALAEAVLKSMSANGITSLMDARVGPDEEDVWRRLYKSGKLDMRVRMALSVDDFVDEPYRNIDKTVQQLATESDEINNGKKGNIDPNFLRAGVVKVFADGDMEYPAQTAALLCPYLDAHGKPTKYCGKLNFQPKSFARLVTKLDKKGLTVHVHAIGDRAVRMTLDAFAAARKENGDKDNRHQIAHLQLVDPADFPRFKALGVIADFQLYWARRDESTEGPLEPYLGPDRYRYLYPAGSLLKAGAMIVGGSDWDVSSYNPFCAFQTAVTRRCDKNQEQECGEKKQKKEPLNIKEAILITTAVDAYTINAAFALKQEATTGSLEVGKRADLIVLDRDIFSIDSDTIADTKVLKTYLDGRLVYTAPANGAPSKRRPSCESD